MDYFYTFNRYLQELHHQRLWRLPLSTNHPCPNRIEGKTGCTFCDGISFLPGYLKENDTLENQMERGMKFFGKRYKVECFYGYFQFNTGTYGNTGELLKKYKTVLDHDRIKGMIISTRPDYIYPEIISGIAELNKDLKKDIWIELGLQSVFNETLKRINRNHTYEEFVKRASLINELTDFKITVHMIIGLPGEDPEKIRRGLKKLFTDCRISGIKFRLLEILPGTAMFEDRQKNQGDFFKFDPGTYSSLLCDLLEIIPEDVVIMRLSNFRSLRSFEGTDNKHYTKDQLVDEIKNEFNRRGTKQGVFFKKLNI